MKILIVTQYFWPESFRINDLALGLKARGHDVTVLTGIPNYPSGKFFEGYGFFSRIRDEYGGIPIRRVPLLPRGNGGGLRLMLNFFSFALAGAVLAPFVCRKRHDVILVFQPSPITVGIPARVLKWFRKTPILFWVQDLWPQTLSAVEAIRSPRLLNMVDRLVRWIYHGCDLVLVQSRAFIDVIKGQGVSGDRVRYFSNSAEAFYRPVAVAPDAAETREIPGGFRVMFAGNIGAAQDFPTILAAAELLKDVPEIKWVIVGSGRMLSWVEEEVDKRGLQGNVVFLSQKPAEAMPRYLALADCLLVTLKREPIFAMTIPSKLQSAMACAKPVVAALEGEGAAVIDESGGGICCAPEDPRALADAVLRLYGMSGPERQAMGENGRQYFLANFEREMLLDRLEEWMREVTAGS